MQEVRLGIIGVNGRGRLWRFWHKPAERVQVAAGADISSAELEKFKEKGGCMLVGFVLLFSIGTVITFLMGAAGRAGCVTEFTKWNG